MWVMSAQVRSEVWTPAARQVFDGEVAERVLGATVLWRRADVPGDLLNAVLAQGHIDRGGLRRGIVEVAL